MSVCYIFIIFFSFTCRLVKLERAAYDAKFQAAKSVCHIYCAFFIFCFFQKAEAQNKKAAAPPPPPKEPAPAQPAPPQQTPPQVRHRSKRFRLDGDARGLPTKKITAKLSKARRFFFID